MNAAWAIFVKDLTIELRLRQVLPTMVVFAVVLVTVFGLAAQSQDRLAVEVASGMLWLAFAFAGLLATERAFAAERESHTLAALTAAPIARSAIFLGKCLSSAALVLLVQLFVLPLAGFFFENQLAGCPVLPLAGLILLGDAALIIVGTLTGAMVAPSRIRGPLLTVLALPLLIPVLVFSTACTAELAVRGWTELAAQQMATLAVFDVVFGAAAYLLFPHVIEQ